ncbi:unnamed protein product [Coregonus sp. 'balchen']|nr:unnamed protein product [Coregonus sp. 'balchen']
MSDGYDGLSSSGKGDGKPRKHHRKSTRTRSRQEKTNKPKLSMLNVSNTGNKMVESQLETHNHKMAENGFILPIEKEMFIDQLKDIVDKAEDMLSEEMEGETYSALGGSPQLGHTSWGPGGECSTQGRDGFIICPVQETPTSSQDGTTNMSADGTTTTQHDGTTTAQPDGSAVSGKSADGGTASGRVSASSSIANSVSGGSGGFNNEGYGLCSPPILSSTDPLLLAMSHVPAPSGPPSVHPGHPPEAQPAFAPPAAPSGGLRSSLPGEEHQVGGRLGAVQQMAEMACAASMVEEVPCCPLAMPMSLDVSGGAQGSSAPLTPLPPQDSSPSSARESLSYPSVAHSDRSQPSVVVQQPFSSMGGAKAPSLPQSPATHQHTAGGPSESDGEGRGVGVRGGFVDSTIKTLDEKLRNLLYQEYAPMYPSGSAAETPGSGTEYPQIPERMDSLSTLSDSAPPCLGDKTYPTLPPALALDPEAGERKQRRWSSAASPAHPAGHLSDHRSGAGAMAMAPSTIIGRFSVVSTEDDVTLSTCGSRYSAPPDFYLDTPPAMAKRGSLPRASTSTSVSVDVTVHAHARFLSSDSGAESSPAKLAPDTPSRHGRSGERRGSDLMKRAVAFLRRSGRSSSVQSSDSLSRQGGVHGSAYVSSDNDSEMEDSDMKRELTRLREKHLKELSELQAHHRGEIELLYRRLGKATPPPLGLSHTAPPKRRSKHKHKMKAGKLLSPLVQQLRHVTTKTSDPRKTTPVQSDSRARSGTSPLDTVTSTSEPVQTKQPCSLKGWPSYPPPPERVTYKSSSKPRARFLSGPVSLSICLYLLLSSPPPLLLVLLHCSPFSNPLSSSSSLFLGSPPLYWSTLKRLCLGKERGRADPGPGPGASTQLPQQQTASSTPPPRQPIAGLAQAQANNSNNKTDTYTGTYMGSYAGSFTDALHRIVDDWTMEALCVSRRPRTSSLSLSGQPLWNEDPGGPRIRDRLFSAPDAPARTALGSEGPQLPLSWPMIDNQALGSVMRTSSPGQAGFHPGYMLAHSGTDLFGGLLPSPLSPLCVSHWPELLCPLGSGVVALPAVPPTWGTTTPGPPYEPPDPKPRTL